MTSRERVAALFDRRTPDRLPKDFRMTPPLELSFREKFNASDHVSYFGLDVREVVFNLPSILPDFSVYYPEGVPAMPNDRTYEVGEWGVGQTPGSVAHFTRLEHPMKNLTSVSELQNYPFPDMSVPERHQHLDSEIDKLHRQGYYVVAPMEWTIFEISWLMRGMDNLFSDIMLNPEFATYLLDRVTEIRSYEAKRFAQAGVDMIQIGDDVGTQRAMLMSAGMYREWFKPRQAAVILAARQANPNIHIRYHSDGNCWEIIPDLIDIGVTVLNPVQPECLNIGRVKQEFGKDLRFWGGIGTQTTMPFSTPEEVYDSVRTTIDILGPCGFFPAPTHVLEPEVPWDNVLAYMKAVDDYVL